MGWSRSLCGAWATTRRPNPSAAAAPSAGISWGKRRSEWKFWRCAKTWPPACGRQTQLEQPADTTGELYQGAMDVFGRVWHLGKPIRMMTVTAISLTQETRQLSLFDDGRGEKLARSVDQIRQKFGDGAIRPAALLGREE